MPIVTFLYVLSPPFQTFLAPGNALDISMCELVNTLTQDCQRKLSNWSSIVLAHLQLLVYPTHRLFLASPSETVATRL
jgi:hypothetical protein